MSTDGPRFTSRRARAMPESVFARMDAAKAAARASGLEVAVELYSASKSFHMGGSASPRAAARPRLR